MLVTKQGRLVTTSPAELNARLGRESGKPVDVANRGVAFLRANKKCGASEPLPLAGSNRESLRHSL